MTIDDVEIHLEMFWEVLILDKNRPSDDLFGGSETLFWTLGSTTWGTRVSRFHSNMCFRGGKELRMRTFDMLKHLFDAFSSLSEGPKERPGTLV